MGVEAGSQRLLLRLPQGLSQNSGPADRTGGLLHANRCSHTVEPCYPDWARPQQRPPQAANRAQRFEFRPENQRCCHSQSNMSGTGQSLHTGPSSESNPSHQTGSLPPRGGSPSRALGAPSCLSEVAMTLTSKDHGPDCIPSPRLRGLCRVSHLPVPLPPAHCASRGT